MWYLFAFVAGTLLGIAVTLWLTRLQRKVVEHTFASLSRDALQQNAQLFLTMAGETLSRQTQAGASELDNKKQLIDQTLEAVKGDLLKVERLMAEVDGKREKSFGEVSAQLKFTAESTSRLQETTGKLQSALANSRVRGQWGERMAEDVLRLAGLVEEVNYRKQKTLEAGRTRPDFTFLLPEDREVNMDVKFPLDNYLAFLNASSDADRDGFRQKFLSDVRQKVKEIKTRDYVNDRTVDYALMFIPNEQVFCFLQESDAGVMDDCLRQKVILCSPLTLFAVLSVVREAVQVFNVEQTHRDILALIAQFDAQWGKFKDSMDKVGRKIREADEEFDRLTSTRASQLEKPLNRIEELRRQSGTKEISVPHQEAE